MRVPKRKGCSKEERVYVKKVENTGILKGVVKNRKNVKYKEGEERD